MKIVFTAIAILGVAPMVWAQSLSTITATVISVDYDADAAGVVMDTPNQCGSSNYFIDASNPDYGSYLAILLASRDANTDIAVTVSECRGGVAIVSSVSA